MLLYKERQGAKECVLMFTFILYDDNELELNLLADSINTTCTSQGIDYKLYKCKDLSQTLEFAKYNKGRRLIYLLDILDADGDAAGLTIANEIRKCDQTAYIVFVSGHHEYVLLAFKKQAFDFIIKPFNQTIIENLINRIRLHFDAFYKESNPFIILDSNSVNNKIFVNEITYLEKDSNLLIVHTTRGVFKGYLSFKEALTILGKHGFHLCHKSYIVNPNSNLIKCINKINNRIEFLNGDVCYMSRNYRKGFLENVLRNI